MLDVKLPVNRKLRAAIIGCGKVAGGYDLQTRPEIIYTHAKAYKLQEVTELVAVADIDFQRAHKFSTDWEVSAAYDDVTTMLSDVQPDIVSICTPDNTHASMLEICLECSSIKAVWSEKPLATDINKAEKIVSAYTEKGIVLAINYQRRWDEKLQNIKRVIQQHELGIIQKVLVFYTKGVCHNGSHAVDLLIDWFGFPKEMQVFGSHVDFVADDPTVDARLLFDDTIVYLIGVDEREYSLFEIHILGTLGRINILGDRYGNEWYERRPDPLFSGYRELRLRKTNFLQKPIKPPMALALEEIIHALSNGGAVRSNGNTSLKTLRVCRQLAIQAIKGFHENSSCCL